MNFKSSIWLYPLKSPTCHLVLGYVGANVWQVHNFSLLEQVNGYKFVFPNFQIGAKNNFKGVESI